MRSISGTKRLQELGKRKRDLLHAARELSIQQVEVMQNDDIGMLLSILSRKSEILDTLATLQRDLEPYRDQKPEERQWDSSSDRAECQATFGEIDRLLEELSQMDKSALDQLTSQRDSLASQISHFTTAEVVQNAYASSFLSSDSEVSTGFSLEG